MITDHKYDGGPNREGGCIATVDKAGRYERRAVACGQPEQVHATNEYEDFSGEAQADAWQANQDARWLAENWRSELGLAE